MMNSTEKSLPEKLSDDIIAYILEEQLQPNDKLPNESVLSEKWEPDEAPSGKP